MIPIGAFLTPDPGPMPYNPAVPNAIGHLADDAARKREFDANLAVQKQKVDQDAADAAAKNAIQREHVQGTNKYYDSKIDIDREYKAGLADERKQKKYAALEVALRKAKSPAERDLILQAFKRLGAQVTEQDTDLPEADPATGGAPGAQAAKEGPSAVASSMQAITGEPTPEEAPYAKGQGPNDIYKARPTNKKLASALAESAGGAPAPAETPEDQAALEGIGIHPFDRMVNLPGPVGHVPSETGVKAAEKPFRGGKHILTEADGTPILTYDAPVEQDRRSKQINATFDPLLKNAVSPQEKAAAGMAKQAATAYFESHDDFDGAQKFGMDVFKSHLGEYKKIGPGGGGGGGVGGGSDAPTKGELKLDKEDRDTVHQIITRVGNQYTFKATRQALSFGRGALQHLDAAGQGGMQQLAALKDYMLQKSGKVVTDREMDQFLGSTGAWNGWMAKFNKYTDGANMPKEFLRQFRGILKSAMEESELERKEAADTAYEEAIRETGGNETLADVARGHFLGEFSSARPGPTRPGAKRDAKASAKGDVTEEETKKFLESRKKK